MAPNKTHSNTWVKCYYIFFLHSLCFHQSHKSDHNFDIFLFIEKLSVLKIPADALLWCVWKEAHILLGSTYRKTPTSSKLCSAHVPRPFQSPDHSRPQEAEQQQPQEDSRVSQQGKDMFPLSCCFSGPFRCGKRSDTLFNRKRKQDSRGGNKGPQIRYLNGSANSKKSFVRSCKGITQAYVGCTFVRQQILRANTEVLIKYKNSRFITFWDMRWLGFFEFP